MVAGHIAYLVFLIVILIVGILFWSGRRMGRGGWAGRAIAGAIVVLAVIMTISAIMNLFEEMALKKWPAVEGTIISSRVVGERAFHPEITFSYIVDDKEFTGTSALGTPGFGGKRNRLDQAEILVSKHRPGDNITIYYNPDNPEESLLKTGITYTTMLQIALGIILLGSSLILLFRVFRKA